MEEAIGGYFGLELSATGGEYYRNLYRFQSARAAFLALLKAGKPGRIWMPWYICDSMIETAEMAGVPISRYRLDAGMMIEGGIQLGSGDWLVYINYFGLCDANVKRVLQRFSGDRVIVDNSQAFFSSPMECMATLYSARKFFGVPDGGYLKTAWPIAYPEQEDDGSLDRCEHLLSRIAISPEAGYSSYQASEESLRLQQPMRMSRLTRRLLSAIDYETARQRRSANAALFHEKLGPINAFALDLPRDAAPLCYPFLADDAVRKHLIERRIFVPRYWPAVCAGHGVGSSELVFSRDLLPLPCDQRMDFNQIEQVVDVLTEAMAGR